MIRSTRLGLLGAAAIAVASIASGCSTGGGGASQSPTPSPTPAFSPTPTVTPPPGAVVEVEPNDVDLGNPPTAIMGTGAQAFFGVCADDNDNDYYAFTVGSGMVAAQITWSESTANDDLDLFLEDTAFQLVLRDNAVPPGDSPANVQGVFTTSGAMQLYVEVDCYTHSPNVAYVGEITRP